MRYSILGFSQKIACSLTKTIKRDGKADLVLKLDMTDLLILQQLADFPNRKRTKKQIVDDKLFFWVDYKELLEELPILDIKKQALRDRLDKMVELKVLEKVVVNFDRLGSATCFRMGDNYETLLYSDDSKQSTTQGCVVDYTGGGSELHDNNNKGENKDTKYIKKENLIKESEIVDFWNENTEDYPKVKKVSDKVKKAIKARLNEGYSVEEIKCAILLMNTLGDFYKGKGDSHWKADFLWLMQNTKGNFEKILAGGLHVTAVQKHQYEIVMASQGKVDDDEYHPIYDDKSEIQFDKKANHYRLIGKDPRFSRVYDGYNDDTRPDGAILLTQYGKMKWSSESKEWDEIR